MYFNRVKTAGGDEPNKDLRTFQGMKNNDGVLGGKFDLEWKDGLFRRVIGPTSFDKLAAEQKAEEVFLTLLTRFNAQGRNAGTKPGTSYAPALFENQPDNQGPKAQFSAAMERLLKDNKIRIEESGPRRSQTLVPMMELDANDT